ncbi:MAG TPA: chemotaxis protein CheB [Saprospiraceae bacterium]|nr:chemotaxis protein CheB [Saprospiraceae bacterium]
MTLATKSKKTIAKKTVAKKTVAPVKRSAANFQIVAIGSSAGGLEAITDLLKYLPSDTGMAFIYVQHLSPDHKSLLVEILSKKTRMKVQEIDDMDKIKPNEFFVIPYNKGIEVTDGHIKLTPRSKISSAISIDILFSSLAHSNKERVIGVILSGSASDGTRGMKDIKNEGGLTFAQDESAKFPSMPQSAIAAGVVDFVLSPKEIALELSRLSKHPLIKRNEVRTGDEDLIDNNDPDLKNILTLLLHNTGGDFSQYKMNTIKRRIVRRMLLYKIKTLKEYSNFLKGKIQEIDILHQDLLINVTSFFRETETHKYLKTTLLPKLLKSKIPDETLRIWVPACSTGEEAFSIAMMLIEIQDSKAEKIPVQIFATDLSEPAILKARAGIYSKHDLETVSPQRLQRFFTKVGNDYRINKAVRILCVFAPHNILTDPPFSKLDFVSCCNLFIYLDTSAQKKAVRTFHYALNENGYLMVGKSENISSSMNLFSDFNKKFKIYLRKNTSNTRSLPVPSPRIPRRFTQPNLAEKEAPALAPVSRKKSIVTSQDLDNAIDAVLISSFMPASVVINYNLEILQFRGSTDEYLTHAQGKATFNILKMSRPEIAFELRIAVTRAIKENQRVARSGIELNLNDAPRFIGIEVVPLKIQWDEPLLLVLFSKTESPDIFDPVIKGAKRNTPAKDRKIKRLEEELAAAHADSLTFLKEQETYTEELQRANEEVISSNEELQTLNEELETSKEEIESSNEELTTTNQELQTRNELLDESYRYSEAITSTIHEPMIVLDKNLIVKSANKAFYKEFKATPEETEGTLLYNLGHKQWNIPRLRKLLEDIIPKNSRLHDYEVTSNFPSIGEKVMLLNASRINQNTNREELILLAIHDVTEVRIKTHLLHLKEKELLHKEVVERKAEKESLEDAVGERTKELKIANESLIEKNLELLNMNKELESFTYISSHDLQEPLRKIQTLAGRIMEKEHDNLSDHGKNYFRLMQNAAQRMRTLIQDLLAFSHLSNSERTFELYDLKKIIEEVKIDLKSAIEEKKATIKLGQMCKINIIPFQFHQLLQNLINNSLKYSNPAIPPDIFITSSNIKNNKDSNPKLITNKKYCHIAITDNGIGFEKEFSEKIFEVFQRLHGKEEYAGTGIGLAIVKKIVDNHNGIITATSVINKGTTFDIFIPSI